MVLFETERQSPSSLYKGLIRRPMRIMGITLLIGLINAIFFDSKLITMFAFVVILFYFVTSMMHLLSSKDYIYKIVLDGDRLDVYYLHRGKEKIFNLYRDNFVVTYSHWESETWFVFEQQRPYKELFTQYAVGYWNKSETVNFLAPYGKVILPK